MPRGGGAAADVVDVVRPAPPPELQELQAVAAKAMASRERRRRRNGPVTDETWIVTTRKRNRNMASVRSPPCDKNYGD